MGHVSEHHSEQEGECDGREEGRVSLFVSGRAIRLHDFIGGTSVGVEYEMGRVLRCFGRHDLARRNLHVRLDHLQQFLHVRYVVFADVDLSGQEVVEQVHFVEGPVKVFFFEQIEFHVLVGPEHLAFLGRRG